MLENQDIIVLQEVTTGWRACNGENQPKILAKRLNRYAAYAPAYEVDANTVRPDGAIVNTRRGFGNMVLSRWPIIYFRPHSPPRSPAEVPPEFHFRADLPRTALETVIDCDGTVLRVISVHLRHLPGLQRRSQSCVLKQLVLSLPGKEPLWVPGERISAFSEHRPAPDVPTSSLLFGDFNFGSGDPDCIQMLEPFGSPATGLIDGWQASKHKSRDRRTCVENDGRLTRLDHMFATPDLSEAIVSARVDQTVTASDHFPA